MKNRILIFCLLFPFTVYFNLAAYSQTIPNDLPRRGFLGAQLAPVSDETRAKFNLPAGRGIQILRVDPQSSAEAANLAVGDVVLKLNDKEVSNTADFIAAVRPFAAGDKIQLTFLRDGKEQTETVTLKPRPLETNPDFDVLYGSVTTADGRRRVIITKPKGTGKFPAVLMVGGIGCYSLDNFPPSHSYRRVLYGLTEAGFATMRVEKSGIGDSEGAPCNSPQVDLKTETAGYVAGLKALKSYNFVDAERTFIFGHSIGGIVGPLVAAEVPVKGVIAAETIGTNWAEYDFENYRRQAVLRGIPFDQIEREAKQNRFCKEKLWYDNQTPEQITKENPDCADWLQAPASYTYMRQLVALNLGETWKKAASPALVIYGTSDFVTSADEHKYLRDMINSFRRNSAVYVEIAQMDHYLQRAATQSESLERVMNPQPAAAAAPEFHEQFFTEVLNWLKQNAGNSVAAN